MQSAIDSFLHFERPPSVLGRLGLHLPSRDRLLAVAATFHAYHAVKRNPQLEPHQHDANLRTFADAFRVACSESGLVARASPVDDFIAG